MSNHPERKNIVKDTALRLFALALLLFSFSAVAYADEPGESIKVERVSFPVTLSDGAAYEVAGYLYYQGSYHNRTLLLALHGGNYNHKYWDVPEINGHEYSFARYMAARKYAVLAVDQLGAGESGKPDGDLLTLEQSANAIHQIITQLRTGENASGYAFERVVTVGHSLGSINAVYEQGTYHDADALVTTGLGHAPHPLPIPDSVIGEMLQHEYFPFPSELRSAFYYAPGADPDVIAYDGANLADLLARGQLTTGIFNTFDSSANRVGSVTGPVLVQMAEFDALFPSTPYADGEAAFYTGASSVTVQSLPGVGHDVNTHFRNHEGWRLMDEWLRSQGLGR
ncbi:MAG TPA: alpha/beta fold hydrolase [Pyrinomonadaceae bacterium]|jgi:pimeloyl-ACP methyl ester carboxylesterase|nr:alpha/beta fold hydrolase [Pyrinomonadaceae bacterium]